MKKKIDYIDGLKGIGCMMVMVGHYYYIYSLAESFVPVPKALEYVCKALAFFLDPNLGLIFFALLSGYCLAISRVENWKKLLRCIVKRFFRLWLPVLGANILIYMLYCGIGFYNADTATLFANSWFQSYYQNEMWLGFAIKDSVKTVLGNGALFNAPFWVIRYFFYSSIIVYAGTFFENMLGGKFRYILYLTELIIAIVLFSTNGAAIIVGSILYKERNNENVVEIVNKKIVVPLAVVCFVLLSGGAEWVSMMTTQGIISSAWARILYAAVILYVIERMDVLQKVFSNKYLLKLNKISFGIYALHWPIICSVSSMLFMQREFDFMSYIVIGMFSFGIVLLCALIYHVTVEKFCNLLLCIFETSI